MVIGKIIIIWIATLSFVIGSLLFTNHPGYAIKFANYLFYGLVILIMLNILKHED